MSLPPYFVSQAQLAQAILSRLDWATSHRTSTLTPIFKPTTLWGKPYNFANTDEQLAIYRHALQNIIPDLQAKWQPIVGAVAQEVRIKKMTSRFGTCNHLQKRIWLSLYLPKFDYECTEYVFVHELCHLHHPNHSQAFWQSVQNAMPDYQQWHQFLKEQSLND